MRRHFSRGQGPSALGVIQRRIAGRAKHEIPRPERFKPLSDENFSAGKVRELRASPYHFSSRTFFQYIFNTESSGHFPEVAHCTGGSRSFASRPLAVGTAAGGDFASGDQLTQQDRTRTESPARIIICKANYFFYGKMRQHFSRGQGPSALGVIQRRNAGRAKREIPRLRRPACAAGPHQD